MRFLRRRAEVEVYVASDMLQAYATWRGFRGCALRPTPVCNPKDLEREALTSLADVIQSTARDLRDLAILQAID